MMGNLLALISLLFIFQARADSSCQVFEYQGVVRLKNDKMLLIIHENTLSQVKFNVPIGGQLELAPYVDLTVKGKLHISNKKLKRIQSADYGEANPLDPQLDSYLRAVKGVCRP